MNVMQVNYGATGASTAVDALGMRDMQARAYAKRRERYLLLKAPPASGKSRALMYLALDKLERQGLRKVIVAVPERTIGGSFAPVRLTENGFSRTGRRTCATTCARPERMPARWPVLWSLWRARPAS